MSEVKDFFEAKTFAVVGASRDEEKVGHAIFRNILQSNKKVFPVNQKADEILEQKCYKDLLEIPYNVDCVVIAIPAKAVPVTLRHAAKKKAKCAVILSAGFSEIGNKELEEKILSIAKETKIKILGPNSYGFIDPHQNLSTSYFLDIPKKGHTAFISQSGAIGSAILDLGRKLSGFVSVGNCAELGPSDFIEYYSHDEKTKVITLYLESLKKDKGQEFIKTCKKCKKPIVVLKSGKSTAGQHAAASHTAALATEDGVYDGILKQSGCIQVYSIKQLFNVAKILEKFGHLGKRAAIVTNAGGLGVLTADACEENKIEIKKLTPTILEKLNKVLPENWSHNNPIDLIGNALAKDYENALKIIEKGPFDFIIVLLTPQKMTEAVDTAKLLLRIEKPVVACFLGGHQVLVAKKLMKKFGALNFQDPKEMCEALGKSIK